ncbi:uncharacterized protein TNCV_3973141 [Trichonephila clavipes]|nr:uncharacterized protein TNCV_3973141 [Trichonephila clavipes]
MCIGQAEPLNEGHLCVISDTSGCLDDQQETSESQMNCSLMMSPELSDEQRNKLSELLRKFSGLFTKTYKSTAAKTNVKHRILLVIMLQSTNEPTESRRLKDASFMKRFRKCLMKTGNSAVFFAQCLIDSASRNLLGVLNVNEDYDNFSTQPGRIPEASDEIAANGKPSFESRDLLVTVADWYKHRIVAGFVTSSSPVPLKTRRVGQRCTLNLSRAETSSRWCGVVVRRGGASSGVVHVT